MDCDCYDFCGSPRPPCAFFQHSGCSSGYDDFFPIAAATGGNTHNIDLALQNLLSDISIHITTHRTLCYFSPCCYANQPRTVTVTVNWNAQTGTDTGSFTRTSCPTARTHHRPRRWTPSRRLLRCDLGRHQRGLMRRHGNS